MSHFVLGKQTEYPKKYSPDLLVKIHREEKRPAYGADIWTAYELSWLNSKTNHPEVGILEIIIPCSSTYIVESKSLKLYLNSLYQSNFESIKTLEKTIQSDLKNCLGCNLELKIIPPTEWNAFSRQNCEGICIDVPVTNTPTTVLNQTVYSHIFRSICPVTSQPDWATILITYTGNWIHTETLLQHLISYRDHPGFHEECIEKIFWHILKNHTPKALTIQGLFTRRGGIDINPIRSTENIPLTTHRTFRQ